LILKIIKIKIERKEKNKIKPSLLFTTLIYYLMGERWHSGRAPVYVYYTYLKPT